VAAGHLHEGVLHGLAALLKGVGGEAVRVEGVARQPTHGIFDPDVLKPLQKDEGGVCVYVGVACARKYCRRIMRLVAVRRRGIGETASGGAAGGGGTWDIMGSMVLTRAAPNFWWYISSLLTPATGADASS
jgi:hypothetical protein